MAATVKQSDIDKILKDNTKELSDLFKKIQTDAFDIFKDIAKGTSGMTQGFVDAQNTIKKLNTSAEQYLGIQRLQETIQSKINELKSKTGYLDATALAFKSEEVKLQNAIIDAQIKAARISLDLNTEQTRMLINQLAIQKVKNEAELGYLEGINGKQNEILEKLKRQSDNLGGMTPTLEKQNVELDKIKEGFKAIGKELTGINIGMPTFFDVLLLIVQQFGAIENAAFAVRQNMGLLRGDMGEAGLYKIVQNVSNEFTRIGVTAEIVGKSINSISNAFGNSAFASKEIVTNLSALEASFGISGDTSAKVLKSMMGISQSSAKSQVSMIGFAKEFSNAAGVPLTEVMKDLSTLSESVRTTFRGSTLQLVKSTVEARKLGITINEAGNVAEKLLNFTESINAEIEASVMLGRNISFQDARTLAYKGDILGATKNILDTIEQTADLNKLDALQLKSISEASGLTAGQLQDSLQIRKDLKQLQLSGNAEAQKQVDLYNQLNGLGKYAAEMKGNEALENIKNTNNLAIQKQIQAELLGLLYKVADALMPIFKGVGLIAQGINAVNTGLRDIVGETAGAWVSGIALAGAAVLVLKSHWLSMFSSILTKIPFVSKALNAMGMGSSAAGAAGASKSFGKGAMFAGVGSFMKSLGSVVILIGAAAAIFILGKAVSAFPDKMGGMDIFTFLVGLTAGLAVLLTGLTALGFVAPAIAIPLASAGAILLALAGVLYLLGKSLQTIADPIKTFSDSFSKLIDNINTDNLSKMKDGVVAVKEAMTELRGELRKFNKDDLSVLDKLGNLTTNVSTATETVKKNNYADLTNAIVTAIQTGMSNIQITVESDGTIKQNFREEKKPVSRSGM